MVGRCALFRYRRIMTGGGNASKQEAEDQILLPPRNLLALTPEAPVARWLRGLADC